MGRPGPRRRVLRRPQRLRLQAGHDQGRGRQRAVRRQRRPHPGQPAHPEELEGGDLCRRAGRRRTVRSDRRRLPRKAGRAARRHRRADGGDPGHRAAADQPRRDGWAEGTRVGDVVTAEVKPFAGPDGTTTTCGTRCSPTCRGRLRTSPRRRPTRSTCPSTGWSGPSRAVAPSSPTTRWCTRRDGPAGVEPPGCAAAAAAGCDPDRHRGRVAAGARGRDLRQGDDAQPQDADQGPGPALPASAAVGGAAALLARLAANGGGHDAARPCPCCGSSVRRRLR